MPADQTRDRAAAIEAIIPHPPADIAPMRTAFTRMVSRQWQRYVPQELQGREAAIGNSRFAKAQFIAEAYARACYSMALISGSAPRALRIPVRAALLLSLSRGVTISFGAALLARMDRLLSKAVQRQLLLMSALMGVLDVVLDDAAPSGEAAVLRVASLMADPAPPEIQPAEEVIVTLARAARRAETVWQAQYWERILQPAVREYCLAEGRAVRQLPDPTGMGHRSAGIDGVLKGMWYVMGPLMGLQAGLSQFEKDQWNREQQWMADTTLLMQMIDDWVDQDEDRDLRLTPVVTGDWTLDAASDRFEKTIRDLDSLFDASGIRAPVLKAILSDLYRDYLHSAIDAMRSGVAA